VDDSIVDEVTGATLDLVNTNSPNDGIVFVCLVEDAFYIGNKMRMMGTELRQDLAHL
jgi:nitrogen regulatory protein PII